MSAELSLKSNIFLRTHGLEAGMGAGGKGCWKHFAPLRDSFTWKQKLNTLHVVTLLKRSSAVDSVIWILVEDEGKVVSGSGLKSPMLGIPCSDTIWLIQIYNITHPSLSRMKDLIPCEKFMTPAAIRGNWRVRNKHWGNFTEYRVS